MESVYVQTDFNLSFPRNDAFGRVGSALEGIEGAGEVCFFCRMVNNAGVFGRFVIIFVSSLYKVGQSSSWSNG